MTESFSTDGLLNDWEQYNPLDDTLQDVDDEAIDERNIIKVRGKSKIYNFVRAFKSTKCVEFLKQFENVNWRYKDRTRNKLVYNFKACGRSLYLQYWKEGEDLNSLAEDKDHDHDNDERKNRLPIESVNKAKEMFDNHSNREILRKLGKKNLLQLTEKQLRNLKSRLSKEKFGASSAD